MGFSSLSLACPSPGHACGFLDTLLYMWTIYLFLFIYLKYFSVWNFLIFSLLLSLSLSLSFLLTYILVINTFFFFLAI